MPEAMKEATHALLQTGDHMRRLDAIHPPSVRDMTNAYDSTAKPYDVIVMVVQLVITTFNKEQVQSVVLYAIKKGRYK